MGGGLIAPATSTTHDFAIRDRVNPLFLFNGLFYIDTTFSYFTFSLLNLICPKPDKREEVYFDTWPTIYFYNV